MSGAVTPLGPRENNIGKVDNDIDNVWDGDIVNLPTRRDEMPFADTNLIYAICMASARAARATGKDPNRAWHYAFMLTQSA